MIRHLDLFSGIGGFALATEMVFGKENVEHTFCDNDPFSQAILKKHWPNSPIYGDIKTLTSKETGGGIDLLTGGFPCQPFSAAGRRLGTEDDRHLWPHMLRLIRETHPSYVLGENVGGLLTWDGGMVLKQVLADLEVEGYEVGAFVIPACAVGAPHRRDRVWITAHARGSDARGHAREHASSSKEKRLSERHQMEQSGQSSALRDATNTRYESGRSHSSQGRNKRKHGIRSERSEAHNFTGSETGTTSHTNSRRLRRHERESSKEGAVTRGSWPEDWPTVATRLCTLDDGLPVGLVRPRGWRNAALKGAGNAIVPQVAAEVLRAMMYI